MLANIFQLFETMCCQFFRKESALPPKYASRRTNSRNIICRNCSMAIPLSANQDSVVIPLLANQDLTPMVIEHPYNRRPKQLTPPSLD